ncbi:hypothetical protein D3C81_725400 [compost metagenome]
MDRMGQRRHIDHPGYPLMYVKFYRLFAEADLNGSVSLRPQQQIPFWIPLDAHGRCIFFRRPFVLAHGCIRVAQAAVLQCPLKSRSADIDRQYALLTSVFEAPAGAIHHP